MSLRLTIILTVSWIVVGCSGLLGILFLMHRSTPGGMRPERASSLGSGAGVFMMITIALIWVPFLIRKTRENRERREAEERDEKPRKKKKRRPTEDE